MSLPFWDQGAIDSSGKWPGIVTLIPPSSGAYPDELSPWDVIYLNGVRAPGICRLEGGRHLGLDIQKIIGQLVPEASILNFDPVPFTLTMVLWTPQQWIELQDLIPQLIPPPGPNPTVRAVRAEHPSLGMYGMTTIYFQAGLFPRHVGKGIVEVDFQCYEWNQKITAQPEKYDSPIPQGAKPGSTAPATTVTPPSQNASALGPG